MKAATTVSITLIAMLMLFFATNPSSDEITNKFDARIHDAIRRAPIDDATNLVTRLGCTLSDEYCAALISFIFEPTTEDCDWHLYSYCVFEGPGGVSFYCYGVLTQIKCPDVTFAKIKRGVEQASDEQIARAKRATDEYIAAVGDITEKQINALRCFIDDVTRLACGWLPKAAGCGPRSKSCDSIDEEEAGPRQTEQ